MTNIIYLDHAATTPMHPEVIKVMTEALKENYGNPSSIYQIGKQNKMLIEQARESMAKSIGARSDEIIITSGGTESDNMALIKTAEAYSSCGKHIISTSIEHPAVLETLKYLETKGYEVTYLPVDQDGNISLDQVKEAIRSDTILVSIMYGNNEVGSMLPISEIGTYLKTLDDKIIFHTDAVQVYGVLPLDVDELNVDLLSVSAHKMNGPKGIGFLYVRQELDIPSLLLGGSQENGQRAGTENVPAILAFQKAIEISQSNLTKNSQKLMQLKETFIQLLNENNILYSLNGQLENTLPHILSLSFPNVRADMLLIQMDLQGIALSAGSACTAGAIEPSHVLQAMFVDDLTKLNYTVRISFGLENTIQDLEKTVDFLKKFT